MDPRLCCHFHRDRPATYVAAQHTGGDEDRPATWVPICDEHVATWYEDVPADEWLPIFPLAGLPVVEAQVVQRVEVLHERDPDSECNVRIWIDGVEAKVDYVDIDPGRGYTYEDWDESRDCARSKLGRSDPFREAVDQAYADGRENKYITD